MRRLLSFVINAPKMTRALWLVVPPLKVKNTSRLMCTFQGDSVCNGTHNKKALLSDPQLFEDQFEELVTELTERDLTDPALADALSRLKEVFIHAGLPLVEFLCVTVQCVVNVSIIYFRF